jgi:hypothetical protein
MVVLREFIYIKNAAVPAAAINIITEKVMIRTLAYRGSFPNLLLLCLTGSFFKDPFLLSTAI